MEAEEMAGSSDSQDNTAESNDLEANEQRILLLAEKKPKGISDKEISTEMPDLKPAQRAEIINKLLSKGYFDLFKQGGSLSYRLKDPTKAIAKGADNEEKLVYIIIEEAGNKGIWIRNIRTKSNLTRTQLNKILKSLQTKKFIKAVKSVAASKKKVYMLYDLEPDRSVTGGVWYQDKDFETEFVDVLNVHCHLFLMQKKEETQNCSSGPIFARNLTFASSKEVWKFISDLGISKVTLTVEDLEVILNTLVYDGKIERILGGDGNYLYRVVQPLLDAPGLMEFPCGTCSVRLNCSDDGNITPTKCEYIKKWLDL